MQHEYISFDLKEHISSKLLKTPKETELDIINLFPSIKKHEVSGFGTALTSASGFVLNQMNSEDAEGVIKEYFSPDRMGFEYVRVSIDSCDFSPYMYEAASSEDDAMKGNYYYENDEQFIFPWLKEISKYNPSYKILFSPWSPPAFMKSNEERKHGGRLRKKYYSLWAEYVASYISEYKNRGFNVWGLTLQNEPHAVQIWDSCIYSAKDEMDYLSCLVEALDKKGLSDIKIYLWDHNKERLIDRSAVYNSNKAIDRVYGYAVHGYCGDHFDALSLMRSIAPDKDILLSEFCMPIKSREDLKDQLKEYGHEYLGDIRYGTSGIIDWNLILDEKGGPNHVGNYCLAPVIRNFKENKTEYNMCFFVLKAMAIAFRQGDRIIASTSFDSSLDYAAAVDGEGTVKIVIANPGGSRRVNLRVNGKVFGFRLDKGTINTIILEGRDYE